LTLIVLLEKKKKKTPADSLSSTHPIYSIRGQSWSRLNPLDPWLDILQEGITEKNTLRNRNTALALDRYIHPLGSVLNTQSKLALKHDQQSERYGPTFRRKSFRLGRHFISRPTLILPRAGPILDVIYPLSSLICPSVKLLLPSCRTKVERVHVWRGWK